ncbi:UDP-N-acetylmuramoyl-tripeptide--D-alanyl-D-alanine ligase [Lentiprolixibacter aurantiacus]|uniref:UDP-N-acetylmuramoyl-tripeptide--D-alanyl-D-alanine ligase n=1 Tax=Lentiprolixibacter aurantiacus TaxID=2993939 RepID=A0AAE3MMY4_9FLAO|nr:UDP-N-acetylmuramoyl-tripeptide--D-alanyl-D-alanine ligase [Lentiprolixibacter aurantiacus]MCX2720740.1 UDP-N-acetylmuramoyl-tripeptide--D-alanyl-D-alanine ligase [Lentiprolixibacter aurantiacus]
MEIAALHRLFLETPIVCTDTRKIDGPCIFFALKGENFNGNAYAREALKKGAILAIIDEEYYATGNHTVLVSNALKTLQDLALYHRNYCGTKLVALTGSNGKTTTKELIHNVLKTRYNTIATKGNLNNHIGVPLTLLTINPETDIAIIEMGANHQKEIAFLCKLAEPDYGYITNFGKAHLEGFGGVQGVIKGKSEMYDHLIAHDKFIFFNADDPIQLQKLNAYGRKTGYSRDKSDYRIIRFLGADPFVKIGFDQTTITSQLIGAYNFGNCCAALLIGEYFEVPPEDMKRAIENYVPEANRSQLIKRDGLTIVLDAYNANPSSMKVALENFKDMEAEYKIVFLGDMFELGQDSAMEHQQIAEQAEKMGYQGVFLVGEHFFDTASRAHKFKTFEDLKDYLRKHPVTEGTILIKASRGMALERILDLI